MKNIMLFTSNTKKEQDYEKKLLKLFYEDKCCGEIWFVTHYNVEANKELFKKYEIHSTPVLLDYERVIKKEGFLTEEEIYKLVE
jgi:hypothetical protein